MVLAPGGWFWMGSDRNETDAEPYEKPRHLHWLNPFYIGIACVTVGQFKRFVEETGHENRKGEAKDPPGHPVRFISRRDATAYCDWAGVRLPTEAEWELCARGYEAFIYPWGNDWEDGRRLCWSEARGPGGNTTPVFHHPEGVSALGTFQQSGNLWEWCEDGWDKEAYQRYLSADFRPPGEPSLRVLRGGSWSDGNPETFRGAFRDGNFPGVRNPGIGIRCAKTAIFC
jgi:formylglycine-generating enzyme required for sulfatase activity